MDPLIAISIEPKLEIDREKLNVALVRMASEYPFFAVSTDWEAGQFVLHGNDERHLDHKLDQLIEACGKGFHIGEPQVAYPETITRRGRN